MIKNYKGCLKFKHMKSISVVSLLALSFNVMAKDINIFLSNLNPNNKIIYKRGPSNFIPADDIIDNPVERKHWAEDLFAQDKKGVLLSIKRQVEAWSKVEEYVNNWSLQDTGMYEEVEHETKVKYLKKQSLKYLDKRLSGEIKESKDGSALHSVGQVQSALRPSSKVELSKSIKVRMRAKILQGYATMIVENPLIESQAVVRANGQVNMNLSKENKKIGLRGDINYDVKNSEWEASITKRLTHRLDTVLSSKQYDDTMAFSSETNKTLQFRFNTPF